MTYVIAGAIVGTYVGMVQLIDYVFTLAGH